jgi:ABC-type lipoprotein release transport system permease subunit
MFLKNLFRRKIRSLLTILGIAIGVAAIIGLGALANGLQSGYGSMMQGAKADLVLSQPDAMDPAYSAIDDQLGKELSAAPEVSEVSGMIQGFVTAEGEPFFFVFGYPQDSFVLKRFNIIKGVGLYDREAQRAHGTPILLGSAAAEVLKKDVGDSLRLSGSVYRLVGIYQTGDAFEDSGALLELKEAQDLLGKPRQVSLYYIRLKDLSLKDRFVARVERQWDDLALSGAQEFAQKQSMGTMLEGTVWAIGGLAILIGGIGMMNAQLMAVMERTREIGVLRAVGWSRSRVLRMILMESMVVCVAGGLLGLAIAYLVVSWISTASVIMGVNVSNISTDLLWQATIVVVLLGLVGGLYPAYRAAQMAPVEALRYEGGSSGSKIHRLPVGGMAIQNLWQRSTRTLITLAVIGLTVGAIIALQSVMGGMVSEMSNWMGEKAEIMLRQADIADTSLSAIDDRVLEKIAALPEVEDVNGIMLTAVVMPETGGFFLILGYPPNSFMLENARIIEGDTLTTNHQIILGKSAAESLHKRPGDTLDLSGQRFSVVGVFESKVSYEEMGGIMTLRDAQTFMGKPRKSTMAAIKLREPRQAAQLVSQINRAYPEVHAALAGEFVSQMPDMQNSDAMVNGITLLAVLVGGVGVLNTMLMSVFERTREIGVLRALGWSRRRILGLILREAVTLGMLGGAAGILIAFLLTALFEAIPGMGGMLNPQWNAQIFIQAIAVALALGVVGGLYPAFRATRLQPIEALRYE